MKVAKPLSVVFEKLCQPGEVPADWKMGNIIPIFKKGRRKTQGTIGQTISLSG